MKNLSMFHQMREKAEETKSKERLDDYKMQIVKNLMQKNQMLEEIEKKLTGIEGGNDPVQDKIMDKIAMLENAVTNRTALRREVGGTEGKMNQMVDYMMYNMSVLQQMVQNVAQMQRMQYENTQETNRIMQHLPQILTNARFQSGEDINDTRTKRNKTKVRRDPSSDDQDDETRGEHNRPKQNKETRKISSILEPVDQAGRHKTNDNYQNLQERRRPPKNELPKINIDKGSSKKMNNTIDSDEKIDVDQIGRDNKLKRPSPLKQNTLGLSTAPAAGTPLLQKNGRNDRQPLTSRGQSGIVLTKSRSNNPLADEASLSKQRTVQKLSEEGEEEESSKFEESNKADSMVVKDNTSKLDKTVAKDDSVIHSEGRGAHNKSFAERSRFMKNDGRRKSETGVQHGDITLLNLLSNDKPKGNNVAGDKSFGKNNAVLPPFEGNTNGDKIISPANMSPIMKGRAL